jgi:urease accessory protein
MATGLLHAVGIAIGLVHPWPPGRVALRVAGAAVALSGLYFTARAIA